jgi:hypothetical protein
VSTGFAQVVVTNVTGSVTDPTVHGNDGVAAKLLGPGGWLHVVVIQSGAVPGDEAPHDATGVEVLLAAGRVQMKTK